MPTKEIKNDQWSVKLLYDKINNNEIYKPKYQRKRKWDIIPKKENYPSEKKYIEFLYESHNSVHPITFGQEDNKLSNIDGNNRINAIMHFLDEPFVLFSEKLDIFINDIREEITKSNINISETILERIKEIIKYISYEEVMSFKYNQFFNDNGFEDLYKESLKNHRDELEPYFEKLINIMKINGKDTFDRDVKINVNLFIGYSTEELADVFGKINKYNSCLTEQEALASSLFNIRNFEIYDKKIEYEIKVKLEEYYNNAKNNEKLSCYTYNKDSDYINAYDFMIGFQNLSNEKTKLIGETDNDGVSLFFKIYRCLYKGSIEKIFTSDNINNFIKIIQEVLNILEDIEKKIFMKNFTGGSNKIFDTVNKKLKSLKKNNMFLIIISIIGYLESKKPYTEILNSIELCILYHFLVNSIEDKDKRDTYKLQDGILYEAGGAFIDNKAKDYLKNPNTISCKITEDIMRKLLEELVKENIKDRSYEIRKNGKPQLDKRRNRKIHEKILINKYFINKVPTQFLNKNFWIEHIAPFSCSWNDTIDIDRLGNIFPILDNLNRDRGNKNINEYKKTDKDNFINFIDIVPSDILYNDFVSHDTRKPEIKNNEKYNKFCSDNEKKLIDNFIMCMF